MDLGAGLQARGIIVSNHLQDSAIVTVKTCLQITRKQDLYNQTVYRRGPNLNLVGIEI
jgi:hypothetical protein